VTAINKPFKHDDVREALAEVGVTGLTVTEVKGSGAKGAHGAVPGPEYGSTSCAQGDGRGDMPTPRTDS